MFRSFSLEEDLCHAGTFKCEGRDPRRKRLAALSVENFVVETLEPACSLLHHLPLIAMKRYNISGLTFAFDITCAFLHFPVVGPCAVDPPQEWLDEWIKKPSRPRCLLGISQKSSLGSALHRRAGRRGLLIQDASGSVRRRTMVLSR